MKNHKTKAIAKVNRKVLRRIALIFIIEDKTERRFEHMHATNHLQVNKKSVDVSEFIGHYVRFGVWFVYQMMYHQFRYGTDRNILRQQASRQGNNVVIDQSGRISMG